MTRDEAIAWLDDPSSRELTEDEAWEVLLLMFTPVAMLTITTDNDKSDTPAALAASGRAGEANRH